MMPGARILVVDDEQQIRRSLQVNLEGKGYTVVTAEHGDSALQALAIRSPDVIILDLIMPGMDGIELTSRIRKQSAVPIILLSVISDERKKIKALEVGADDYVTKPFSMHELLARIKALLRRAAGAHHAEPIFTYRDLSINLDRREVRIGDNLVNLTPTEYELLKHMVHNVGKVLTHRMLLQAVWGPAYVEQTQYLRVFVRYLRKKLEQNPARPTFIVTDSGVGYRFCPEPDDSVA
jgi:two-component system, OmpR family, KDP operon response regulator KdpE